MPTPNAELLRQVLVEIEYSGWSPDVIAKRAPEDSDGWRFITFGTEGHAIDLSHPQALWHWQPDPDLEGAEFAVLVSVDGSRKKPGRNASYIARKLLGLDQAQADRLFSARSVDELARITAELCELAGAAP